LFSPDTNQDTANSSKETAADKHRADIIEGLQNGIITWRMVAHSVPPRFQDADSRSGSIWFNRNRITAIANGAHKTLWARMMGFAFIIPFVIFWFLGMVDKAISRKLGIVIFFAGLAALFGWIMVASGLIERPWVNAYKLSIHLSIGIAVFLSLLWVILECFYKERWTKLSLNSGRWRSFLLAFFILLCIQIILGGIVSGMRAALAFPTWPDMNGSFIPEVLLDNRNWAWNNLASYESSSFAPALFQFLHRNTAYLITIISLVFFYRFLKIDGHDVFNYIIFIFFGLLGFQIVLGVLTLVNALGSIPVILGVLHQDVGVLLLASFFTLLYAFRTGTKAN